MIEAYEVVSVCCNCRYCFRQSDVEAVSQCAIQRDFRSTPRTEKDLLIQLQLSAVSFCEEQRFFLSLAAAILVSLQISEDKFTINLMAQSIGIS